MLDINKHRHVLFELIRTIYSSPLGNFLGFKGGTMAYFFYGLDRFSVDLDFDLLDENKKELIRTIMPPLLLKYGILKEEADKRFTIFYLLNYESTYRNIKIEISKRNSAKSEYVIANFYGTDVKIQRIEDAFSTKLLACTTRSRIAYRDFYDVFFYAKKGIVPNEAIIKNLTGKDTRSYVTDLMKFIDNNVTNQSVIHGIGELINQKQKDWIKNRLKKELLNQLKYLIDHNN